MAGTQAKPSTKEELLNYWALPTGNPADDENHRRAWSLLGGSKGAPTVRFSKEGHFATFFVVDGYATFLIESAQLLDGSFKGGNRAFLEAAASADLVERMKVEGARVDWDRLDSGRQPLGYAAAFREAYDASISKGRVVGELLLRQHQVDLRSETHGGTVFKDVDTVRRYFGNPDYELATNGVFPLLRRQGEVMVLFPVPGLWNSNDLMVATLAQANDLTDRFLRDISDSSGAPFPWASARRKDAKKWRSEKGEEIWEAITRVRAGFELDVGNSFAHAVWSHSRHGYFSNRLRLPDGFAYASDLKVGDFVGDRIWCGRSTPTEAERDLKGSLPARIDAKKNRGRHVSLNVGSHKLLLGYNEVVAVMSKDFGKTFDDNGKELTSTIRSNALKPGDIVSFALSRSDAIQAFNLRWKLNRDSPVHVQGAVDMRHGAPRHAFLLTDLTVWQDNGATFSIAPSQEGKYIEVYEVPQMVSRLSNLHRKDLAVTRSAASALQENDLYIEGTDAYEVLAVTQDGETVKTQIAGFADEVATLKVRDYKADEAVLRIPAENRIGPPRWRLEEGIAKPAFYSHLLDGFAEPLMSSPRSTERKQRSQNKGDSNQPVLF